LLTFRSRVTLSDLKITLLLDKKNSEYTYSQPVCFLRYDVLR